MAREVPAALAVELCGQDLLGFLADFARRRGRLDCEAWAEEALLRDELGEDVDAWTEQGASHAGPLRVCFRSKGKSLKEMQ